MIYKSKYFLLSVLIVLFFYDFSHAVENSNNNKKTINLILRYDDFSNLTNTEIEVEIINILKKKKISCTFGVVPDHGRQGLLNKEKINILKEGIDDKIIEVALHGYDHVNIRKDRHSEFYGSGFQKQFQKIAKGKSFLDESLGINVVTFVPPLSLIHI